MTLHVPLETALGLAEQPWLDRPAKALQHAVTALYDAGGTAGRKSKNFWH